MPEVRGSGALAGRWHVSTVWGHSFLNAVSRTLAEIAARTIRSPESSPPALHQYPRCLLLCVILSRSPRIIRCAHSTRLPCTQLIGVRWHACPLSIILINSPNRGSVSFSLSSCSGEYATYWTHTLSPTNTSISRLAAILRLCIVSSSPSLPLLDPKLCLISPRWSDAL